MTDAPLSTPSGSSIASRLQAARHRCGLELEAAAAAASLTSGVLAAMEAGARRPVPAEVDRLAAAYATDLSDVLPVRRPLELDAGAARIGIDGQRRRVRDLRDDEAVYTAYLSLLQAVRGAQPGEHVPLRSSDVDLLMSVLGEDAETVERRLVALMGCSPSEASLLRRLLLRHRALTTAVGVAAVLGLAATGPGVGDVPHDPSAPVHATVSEDVQVATVTPMGAVSGATSDQVSTSPSGRVDLVGVADLPVVPAAEVPAPVDGAPAADEPAAGDAPVDVPDPAGELDRVDEPAPDAPDAPDEPSDEEPDLGAVPVPQPPVADPVPVVVDPAPPVVDPVPVVVDPVPAVADPVPVVVDPTPVPAPVEPVPEPDVADHEPVVRQPVVVEPAPEPVPAVVDPGPREAEPVVVEPEAAVVTPEPVAALEPVVVEPPAVVTPVPAPVPAPVISEPSPEPAAAIPTTVDSPDPQPEHPSSNGQGKPPKKSR